MHQNTRMRMFVAALFVIAPNWRLKCPRVDQINKLLYTYTKEYYQARKIN